MWQTSTRAPASCTSRTWGMFPGTPWWTGCPRTRSSSPSSPRPSGESQGPLLVPPIKGLFDEGVVGLQVSHKVLCCLPPIKGLFDGGVVGLTQHSQSIRGSLIPISFQCLLKMALSHWDRPVHTLPHLSALPPPPPARVALGTVAMTDGKDGPKWWYADSLGFLLMLAKKWFIAKIDPSDATLTGDRLVGLVVRRPPWERKIPGLNPAWAWIFSGSSHTSDLKIGTPVATLPGAWHYRVTAGTGWPSVSILWLGEVECLICNFYLSVAARKIV